MCQPLESLSTSGECVSLVRGCLARVCSLFPPCGSQITLRLSDALRRETREAYCKEATLLKHGGDGGLRDVPFPNMAARPRGHQHGGSAPSQHGGNLARLPALLPPPPLAVGEARAARFLPEPAPWWARGPETPAHVWSRGDDVRRSGATSARARAQSRAIETRRRSVGQGRSLMRSRKVRGPQAGCAPPSLTLPGEPTWGGRLSASSSAPGRGTRTPLRPRG